MTPTRHHGKIADRLRTLATQVEKTPEKHRDLIQISGELNDILSTLIEEFQS